MKAKSLTEASASGKLANVCLLVCPVISVISRKDKPSLMIKKQPLKKKHLWLPIGIIQHRLKVLAHTVTSK